MMPSGLGRLAPNSQVYQASGEATPQERLPEKFISNPPSASPLSGHLQPPFVQLTGYSSPLAAPIVRRKERSRGMRYLYATGHITMPVPKLGADGPPYPVNSAFQTQMHGPIHNAGFNDLLYQAGYPGYNFGLSFKVPRSAAPSGSGSQTTVPAATGNQPLFRKTVKLTRNRRATGKPKGA